MFGGQPLRFEIVLGQHHALVRDLYNSTLHEVQFYVAVGIGLPRLATEPVAGNHRPRPPPGGSPFDVDFQQAMADALFLLQSGLHLEQECRLNAASRRFPFYCSGVAPILEIVNRLRTWANGVGRERQIGAVRLVLTWLLPDVDKATVAQDLLEALYICPDQMSNDFTARKPLMQCRSIDTVYRFHLRSPRVKDVDCNTVFQHAMQMAQRFSEVDIWYAILLREKLAALLELNRHSCMVPNTQTQYALSALQHLIRAPLLQGRSLGLFVRQVPPQLIDKIGNNAIGGYKATQAPTYITQYGWNHIDAPPCIKQTLANQAVRVELLQDGGPKHAERLLVSAYIASLLPHASDPLAEIDPTATFIGTVTPERRQQCKNLLSSAQLKLSTNPPGSQMCLRCPTTNAGEMTSTTVLPDIESIGDRIGPDSVAGHRLCPMVDEKSSRKWAVMYHKDPNFVASQTTPRLRCLALLHPEGNQQGGPSATDAATHNQVRFTVTSAQRRSGHQDERIRDPFRMEELERGARIPESLLRGEVPGQV